MFEKAFPVLPRKAFDLPNSNRASTSVIFLPHPPACPAAATHAHKLNKNRFHVLQKYLTVRIQKQKRAFPLEKPASYSWYITISRALP
jgi:hypothetical protein